MCRNRRWVLVANVVVAAVMVLTACGTPAPPIAETPAPADTPVAEGTPEAPAATPAPPAEKKVLTIATSAGATAMSVGESYGAGPAEIMLTEMYSHLAFRNHDGEIVPELATSWELLDDTTWQFKLREGVKFHNGEDFTADDVKYSFDLALDPERGWVTLTTYELVERVEVVDDYTVDIITSAPFPDLPFFLGQFLIMPDQFTQEVGYEGLVEDPNGTGPFKFVEFVPGDYLKLEAFDDYWDGRVNIDEVLWRLIPEPATRIAALQAGEVDIAAQLPMDLISVVEDDPNLYVDYAYELMCLQLWMDTLTDSPCSDKRVRQAIDYGIDKKAIWEGLMAPVGRLNGQVLTPDVFPTSSRRLTTQTRPGSFWPKRAMQMVWTSRYRRWWANTWWTEMVASSSRTSSLTLASTSLSML